MAESLLGPGPRDISMERRLVLASHNVTDETQLSPEQLGWIDTHTAIVQGFSRVDPNTGNREMLSPGRLTAITNITTRFLEQQRRARWPISNEDIINEWRSRTPESHGRHPDLLFDMAQMNFGTDADTTHIELSIMQGVLRRWDLAAQYRGRMRGLLRAQLYRGDSPLEEDEIDELIEEYR